MINVVKSYEEMSFISAQYIFGKLVGRDRGTLGLATGNTPTGMYKVLVEEINNGILGEAIHYFNIDEYCNISTDMPGTCRRYLEDNFFSKVRLNEKQIYFLNEKNYSEHEAIIKGLGGIDVVILGIGKNGHIAYNEPGAPFNGETHIQQLSQASKVQHGDEFGGIDKVPDTAVTIGIKTIMRSKNILLMASGKEKAQIIKDALTGPITEAVPASILQLHPSVYVVLDEDAASLL